MFSYIILHYKNIKETIECLDYLKKNTSKESHIIVVDNNTLTSEEEKKIKKFTDDILKLDNNYGFAKANNKGIKYAEKKYNSDYYVVINNDVFITQKTFEESIIKNYKKYNFDMLGTKILSPSGESVNPFPAYKDLSEVKNEIKKCNKLKMIYNNSLLIWILKNYIKIKHIIKKPILPTNGEKLEKNVPLHCCAIVFSKKYLKKYDYPFYNDTFLYHEEDFLYQRILKDKLISIYDPTLEVYHKEGSSLNNLYKKSKDKLLFQINERLKSLELLENFIEVANEKK